MIERIEDLKACLNPVFPDYRKTLEEAEISVLKSRTVPRAWTA